MLGNKERETKLQATDMHTLRWVSATTLKNRIRMATSGMERQVKKYRVLRCACLMDEN